MSMHTTEAPSFKSVGLIRSCPYLTDAFITSTHDDWSSDEGSLEADAGRWIPTDSNRRTFGFMDWKVADLLSPRAFITVELVETLPDGSAVFVVNKTREAEDSDQSRIDEAVDELLSAALALDLDNVLLDLPEALASRFRQISGLPDNWDSYGAPPVDEDALKDSAYIAKLGVDMNLPLPAVAPGSDAGIGIEWETDAGELYIDIAPGSDTTYALSRYGPEPEEQEGTLENRGQISRILERLVR